jgi:hypothetical protein
MLDLFRRHPEITGRTVESGVVELDFSRLVKAAAPGRGV